MACLLDLGRMWPQWLNGEGFFFRCFKKPIGPQAAVPPVRLRTARSDIEAVARSRLGFWPPEELPESAPGIESRQRAIEICTSIIYNVYVYNVHYMYIICILR